MSYFDKFFNAVDRALNNHWKKVTAKDKPEFSTVTFDSSGNLITVTEHKKKVVIEVKKPVQEAQTYTPTPPIFFPEGVEDKPALPVTTDIPVVANTSNTTIIVTKKDDASANNNFVSNIVKSIVDSLNK